MTVVFVHIPIIYEYIFYKYFVPWTVSQAQKAEV